MKIILTHKQEIVSAKTGKWVKVGFINPSSGQVDNLFVSSAQFESYEIPQDRYVSEDAMKALEDSSKETEADFDNRGHLVSLR